MVAKKREDIEEEKNIPEAKAIEGGPQMGRTESGEGLKVEVPEQQASDNEKPESKDPSSEAEGIGSGDDEKTEKRPGQLQRFLSIIQALASIATIVVAILTYLTLNEMQTERNNAYSPEIVVAPNTFEGGEIVEGKNLPDGKLMYINCMTQSPLLYYAEAPDDNTDLLYLEIPYLTLKNIGQGTAKDVQISFSKEWMKEVVEVLNRNYDVDYTFIGKIDGDVEYFSLEYSWFDDNGVIDLPDSDELVKRITYIPADESSVIIQIPDGWKKMLAVLYGQAIRTEYREARDDEYNRTNYTLPIPDAIIRITYSDMQGVLKEDELVIPWTGEFNYQKLEEETSASTHLKTGFYEGYIE